MYEKSFDVKNVKCKSFTLEDYIKFLFAKSAENSEPIKEWMNDILKNYTDAEDLSKHESELVIVNLMAHSLNEDVVFQDYICDCGQEFPVKIDPSKVYTNFNGSDINKPYVLGKFKLALKWPKLFADDNVSKMIVDCIDAIYVGDERIELSELTNTEIDDLYSIIMPDDMDNIKNILLAPTLELAVPVVCPKCGKNHVHVISKFKEFVRIL